MLTKIELVGDLETIDVMVGGYVDHSYVLKAASGLGPPDSDILLAGKVGNGALYKGRRVPDRNIVLRIGMNPDYSLSDPVGSLRDKLYNLLESSAGGLITINLIDSVRQTLTIQGAVEKFEVPVSNKEIEVQISFLCPDPFFTTTADVTESPGVSTYNVTYLGTAPVGFLMTIGPNGNQTGNWLRVTKSQTGEYIELDGTTTTNYYYRIDTREGQRIIRLSTGGVSGTYNVAMNRLDLGYSWFKLTPGLNTFVLTTMTGSPLVNSITYRPSYWGI